MSPQSWWYWDGQAVAAFQQWMAAWVAGWKAITWLGDELFYLLAFPLIYWWLSPALGLRAGLLLLFSAQLNATLKLLFHQPRPFWVLPQVEGLVEATSFGLPSGHAQASAAVWGRLAWPWGRWTRGAAALLALLIGLSRVALGVHFWADVLVGWSLGGLTLAVALGLERWGRRLWVRGRELALGVALLFVVASVAARAAWMDPASPWTQAWSLKAVVGTAGAWVGLVWGAWWTQRAGGLSRPTGGSQAGARLLVGMAGLVLLWFGLRGLLPSGEAPLALVARALRYGLVGFWVTGLAPALFRRWRIA